MKQIRIFPMYAYSIKIPGLLISLAGLGLLLFSDPKFEVFIYIGFLIMAFSKEKNENDFVIHNRNEIFKLSFGLYLSFMISLNIVESFFTGFVFDPGILIYAGVPLIFYLFIFYISLIFNIAYDSSFKLTENIRKSRVQYIWLLIFIIAVFVLLIFFR